MAVLGLANLHLGGDKAIVSLTFCSVLNFGTSQHALKETSRMSAEIWQSRREKSLSANWPQKVILAFGFLDPHCSCIDSMTPLKSQTWLHS